MAEVKDLYSHFAWSYVDNWGKEVHGNGRCTSPLEALTKLCSAANVPMTEEIKERFGVNDSVASLKDVIKRLEADVEVLKAANIKTIELISKTNSIVQEATVNVTPEPPKKKSGGRPAGSKNKKK